MAVGLITSPASWLLGTPAAPSWFQNAQDNINGIIGGSVTYAGIVIDGGGGNPVTVQAGHLVVNGGAPAVVFGTGTGTGGSKGLSGCDARGSISVTAGASPATSAAIVTVTFAVPFSLGAPSVIMTPINATAAALGGTGQPSITNVSTTGFTFSSGTTALTAASQYFWNYVCIG